MKNYYRKYGYAAAAISAMFMTSGCAQDISQTLPPPVTGVVEVLATQETTTTSVTTSKTTTSAPETTTTTTTTVTETTPAEISSSADDTTGEPETGPYTIYSDEYKEYILNDDYKEFLSKCVFVGDSICSGLKAYDIIPADRVVAVGNIAARNIFDDWVEFKIHGEKMTLIPALVDLKPEYIVFSMGMNDVNITSEKGFCENYEKILSEVQSFLPDSKLIVCSVTPITYSDTGKLFTGLENIDSFNAALKEYLDGTDKWIYADVEHELKNTHNMLKDDYLGSPDGVHLAPDAYYAILYQICERVVDGKVYNFDGSFSYTDGLRPAQTTSAAEEERPSVRKTAETDNDGDIILTGTLDLSEME